MDVAEEQKYALIHPARKAGDTPYENYCPKAQIDVVVSTNGQETSFTCFPDSTDCSSSACVGNFDPILNENIEEVELSLCVDVNDANTGAIWEINISKVNSIYSIMIISESFIPRQMSQARYREFLWMVLVKDFNLLKPFQNSTSS